MKLYTARFAPNPTKVELYLALRGPFPKGTELDRVTVNLRDGEQKSPEHLARNPFGTVPVLELDDGTFLTESLAIIDFLEAEFPEGALCRLEHTDRARAREIERIVDLRFSVPLFEYVHATRSPLGLPPDEQRAQILIAELEQPQDHLENLLSDNRRFLTGPHPAVADCTLAAALNFARVSGHSLLGSRENLVKWQERFLALEPVREVIGP